MRSIEAEPIPPEMQALLEARAQRVQTKAASDEGDEGEWFAEFRIGPERFALPLVALRSVQALRNVTPVPLSRPEVVGVVRHGGRIVTVYSLAALLGSRGWARDPSVLLLVSPEGTDELVAFDCEEVPRAIALPRATLESTRDASGALSRELVTTDRQVVQLVDLVAVLARARGRESA